MSITIMLISDKENLIEFGVHQLLKWKIRIIDEQIQLFDNKNCLILTIEKYGNDSDLIDEYMEITSDFLDEFKAGLKKAFFYAIHYSFQQGVLGILKAIAEDYDLWFDFCDNKLCEDFILRSHEILEMEDSEIIKLL